MKNINFVSRMVIVASVASNAVAYPPRYSAKTEQIGESKTKQVAQGDSSVPKILPVKIKTEEVVAKPDVARAPSPLRQSRGDLATSRIHGFEIVSEAMEPVVPTPLISDSFILGEAGSGWMQEKESYLVGYQEYQRFALDVPKVSIRYKGETYSIGGASANVVAKWEDFGADGSWGNYKREYLKSGYQLRLNSRYRDKLKRSLDNAEVPETIRHEVTHLLFDQKYNFEKILPDQCEKSKIGEMKKEDVQFIDEMLAFMSEGKTEDEALRMVEGYVDDEDYKGISNAIATFKSERIGKASPIGRSNDITSTNHTVVEVNQEPVNSNSQVGVRGWCKCGAEHGKIRRAGGGGHWLLFISSASKASLLGDYQYRLCGRCWRLFKPKRSGDEAEIIDLRIERKYGELAGSSIPTYKYKELLKQAENKLLDIPDGEVVIPGTCSCKVPDPISNAGSLSDYVCILCGRVRLPDANGNMPQGPTALYAQGLEKFAESAEERMRQWLEKD